MAKKTTRAPKARGTLNRERVLRAAITMADAGGIESLSMRKLAQEVGVEAMSLYNHVDGKDDLIEGIVDLVLNEITWSTDGVDWKKALRQRAISAHQVLLRHFWAVVLLESRASSSPVRYRYAESALACLRKAGFSIEVAYNAVLLMDSYLYGFTLQEVSWPFEPGESATHLSSLEKKALASEYPHMVEVMKYFETAKAGISGVRASGRSGYESEFEFGLDLILDGLDRTKRQRR